jgi:hypothetical protein
MRTDEIIPNYSCSPTYKKYYPIISTSINGFAEILRK